MELQTNNYLFEKRPIIKSKTPAVRWFKEWVPQEVASTGRKCLLLKWVTEDMLKALKNKDKDPEPEQPEPEPSTEVLFLCSYEGCGKTFIDAGALRKHSHIHGERQYVCHYEGCGKSSQRRHVRHLIPVFDTVMYISKKFLDSSKLKRHFLIHTGERRFVCTYEGCGKAFSLDFNLRAHMRTHSQENYHICPYVDCGKRYAHEYKLKTHIKAHHEKNTATDVVKQNPPSEKLPAAPKPAAVVYGSASSDRPYCCPYEGCEKAYIHEYKLNLHLKREHPGHNPEENGKNAPESDNDMDEGSDQDAYARKTSSSKNSKRSRPKPTLKMPPSKIAERKASSSVAPTNMDIMKKHWPTKDMYEEEDSEETEEDRENVGDDQWRYVENEDDEETEYED